MPAGLPATPALLPTLLDLMPLGVIYYTPVPDAAGTLADLTLAYLNPAAQRMTQLSAQPGTTYRQQFPATAENGAWDFHRRCWLGQEPEHFQFYYDADGFDSYFRVTAQRLGEGLLVVFTDTQDEVRSGVENALRASQAREQAALAEAERQQALHEVQRQPADCPLLILLDINMPVMSGIQFLKAYQQLPVEEQRAIVVVMLTTSVSARDQQLIQDMPIADYLDKPLTQQQVERVLVQHFAR